ncbi:MAG: GntR family transcriptional regulator [Desulfobacteraceae bacterium]
MKLVKDSITDQVYHIIKEKILLTELHLGDQINPRELAEEFRVSIMPVRDALRKLVNEGLVVNKSRVGFFVRSFTQEEITDIMEMRMLYELYSLDTYFMNIPKDKLLIYLDLCNKKGQLSRQEFDELDNNIHDLLINASQNRCLEKSYHEVKNQIIIFRHMDKNQIEVAHQEHVSLLQSIINRDKPNALKILRQHIKRVADAIV